MSVFETKIADNFIYDSNLNEPEQDSLKTPFLRKNVAYVVDQQAGNGSYTSGEVIIDSSSIAASGNLIDWRNAYIAQPFQTKLAIASSAARYWNGAPSGGAGLAKFALAMKNNSLLSSLKVEANGKTIITATEGLANLVNFKMMSTMNTSALAKDGAIIGFSPDSQGQIADPGYDSYNSGNDLNSYNTAGDGTTQANTGLIERQNNWLPSYSSFMSSDNVREEGAAYDAGTGVLPSNSTAESTVSDIHWVAIIRLRDLHDYFDKHSLSRGVSYRFTLKFNQAITTIVGTSSITPFAVVPTSITTTPTGATQPGMVCWGASSILGRLTAYSDIGLTTATAAAITATITTKIDVDTTNARFSGTRLYVPSLELEPSHQEELISRNPIIKRDFLDFMTQTTQTFALSGAAINVQVSTSCTNPRALIVIPRWSQTAYTGAVNGGQGYYSDSSPLSTVPGSTDGMLSLTNIQIKLGSNYVLPDRIYYTFQQFQDHVASIFALNGDQSILTSGLISKKGFETNQRYYAFDLSRYPEAMNNLPQMVSFECKNNTQVAVELQCILLYGRSVEQNIANGSMTCTA